MPRSSGSLLLGPLLLAAPLIGTGCSDASEISHEPGVVRQAECITCHETDRKAALEPPHDTLPTTCQDCHTERQWAPAISNTIHTPLPASCTSCHENELRERTAFHTQDVEPECAGCHRTYPDWVPADFLHEPLPSICNDCHRSERPASPTHQSAAGLGDCARCHIVDDWTITDPAALHAPLPASCRTCHQTQPREPKLFHTQVVEPECARCHHDYPDWMQAGFAHAPVPSTCSGCHSDTRPSTPTHQTTAGRGDCVSCHVVTSWASTDPATLHTPLPASCRTCHQSEPRQSTIFHTQGLEPECARCHTNYPDWTRVDFGHAPVPSTCSGCHSDTRPSTSTHQTTAGRGDCVSCHVVTSWAAADPATIHTPLPATCMGCHANEPRSNSTLHLQTYDAECASCHHSYPDWTTASFAHVPEPTRCYDCHESQRPSTTTHPSTGDCKGCHATSAWLPATGGAHPESAFPIQSGAHSRYRNDCASCHNVALGSPVGGENADCVGCHDGEHTRAQMDPKHREVRNYPSGAASPNFCLDCHRDGRHD